MSEIITREKGKISASLMCAGFDETMDYIHMFEENNVEYLHVDVMDGSFVPNLAFGPDYVRRLRSKTNITLDCHLMIERAEEKLDWFDFQPGEQVSFHYEGTCHIHKCLDTLKKKGVNTVVALNPGTPIQVLEEVADYIDGVLVLNVNPGFAGQKIVPHTIGKTARVRKLLDDMGYHNVYIESDGNITFENARKLYNNGSDMFVAGTASIFKGMEHISENIGKLRQSIGW